MMIVVLGGTGNVGSAVAEALLLQGEAVTIVARNAEKAAPLKAEGAKVAIAHIHDSGAIRDVLQRARRAFLLNPPADPSTDTDVEERRTVAALLAALEGSGLERVVAQSTYGAQKGERVGDLSVLYELEEGLKAQPIPSVAMRSAYLMSNWDSQLESVVERGVLTSMLPADLELPMVAPADLGAVAADLLTGLSVPSEPVSVEGPARYTPQDVAHSFAHALGRDVTLEVVPPERLEETFRTLGFSEVAASSYARMTKVTIEGSVELPHDPIRGKTTLDRYVADLVARR